MGFTKMKKEEAFLSGYNEFAKVSSSQIGLDVNDSKATDYLSSIAEEIEDLSKSINSHFGNQARTLHGYTAEDFVRGTFNIDAAAKRTGERCWTPPAQDFASVDVQGNWENSQYQLKFYQQGGRHGAFAQAVSYKLEYEVYLNKCRSNGQPEITIQEYLEQRGIDPNIDVNLPKYQAQARLMPTDQIPDAIKSLNEEIELSKSRGDLARAKRFEDTLLKLTDRVRSPKGAESMPLSEQQALDLAECARKGNFNPEQFDITLAKKADYLYLCQSVALSGLSASIVSSVLKAAPEMAKVFTSFIKDGLISIEDFERVGGDLKQGAKDGFIRGASLAAFKDMCSMGMFGEKIQKVALDVTNPAFNNIAVVVVAVMTETVSDSLALQKKQITPQDFAYRLEKRIFISGCSVIVGTYVQGLMPFAPVIGYVLGSFIGAVLAGFAYEVKERYFISICVEHGYTIFGLVDQDYTLPTWLLQKLGFEVFEPKKYQTSSFSIKPYSIQRVQTKHYDIKAIDMFVLKRGVIGVRKIGYV